MRSYPVIAEMVDSTTGERFYPGDEFTPADEVHLRRLIAAGVLDVDASQIAPNGVPIDRVRDDLGILDVGKATMAQLLVIAAYERADVPQGDNATLKDLRTAIRDARLPGYDRDRLGVLPLQEMTEAELRVVAAYEKIDVADDSKPEDIIAAIGLKRNGG